MGRAKGHTNHNVSALATRSDVVRRPPPVSSLSAALTSIVRSLGAVAASRDEFEDYLAVVDEKAS